MDPARQLIPPLVRGDPGTRGGINSRNSVDGHLTKLLNEQKNTFRKLRIVGNMLI